MNMGEMIADIKGWLHDLRWEITYTISLIIAWGLVGYLMEKV